MRSSMSRILCSAVLLCSFWSSATAHAAPARRPLNVTMNGKWIGNAIAYGPHRDGQRPDGASPTRAQLREDLHLMAKHWRLVRVYQSRGATETMCELIAKDRLPLRVVVGAWIAVTERRDSTGGVVETFAKARAANLAEMDAAIRLAKQYPGIVAAIAVGNETQVAWTDHRVPTDSLIADLRYVRSRTRVPVTTADDFNFWNKPEAQQVAPEIDFAMMHAHPMWNGQQVDRAVAWTDSIVGTIRAAHPGLPVVLAEAGWATDVGTHGDQAKYIKGKPGETEQKTVVDGLNAWARRTHTVTFIFEAFDENWKGSADPAEVEKHWGLYHADRTPKKVMAGR
jgi:exo-beta-1,3-glucanase (GH17 family)